tara:strand:- start:233 stop:1327 length:1095 start_codon:yes stop_codon:yes gene_type:complete
MSEIKVNSIKGVGASTAAITVNNTDGTATANLTNRTNRRLTINGAMTIAQRTTSSTSEGYSVDRMQISFNGTNEAPTHAQVDVASGTTPYTLGFRKALRITNGNQTSGAGTQDYIQFRHSLESQDIANSGWNYTSTSSFITLTFYVKSSVAQNFYGSLRTRDGTLYNYPFETGSLSADTWTKVTKTVPGAANLQFDNDNGVGFDIFLWPFRGTDYTGSSATLNQWQTWASAQAVPDMTTTWYTTNDSTFEITGVQLEVSDHATDFEHRSFAEELKLCERYYQKIDSAETTGNASHAYLYRQAIPFRTEMRAAPTFNSSAFGSDSGTATPSAWSSGGYLTNLGAGATVGSQTHAIIGRALLDAEL